VTQTSQAEAAVESAQDARHVPAHLLTWDLGGGRTLRLARPGEYEAVADTLVAAFNEGCWVTPMYESGLRSVAARAPVFHIWVVVDNAGVLGVVLTPKPQYHRGPHFVFSVLAVGPRGRGLNLGWQLTDHSVALARAFGYTAVELHSSPQMTAAHQLYYRYGFVRRLDWETGVVDSGQRLLSFTYRIPDPTPPLPPIEPEPLPATAWRHPIGPKEAATMTDPHRPAGSLTASGAFIPAVPRLPGVFPLPEAGRGYRLVAGVETARGRAALTAIRLSDSPVEVDLRAGTTSPELYGPAGDLVSDDWRVLPRVLATAAGDPGQLYPHRGLTDVIDLERVIQTDLVDALDRALFAARPDPRDVAARLFYARLGDLDLHLADHAYLVGDHQTGADLALFAVLLGFDLGPRAHLHWAAAIVDYPALWSYARRLFHTPHLVSHAELVGLGFIPGAEGTYAEPWGEPAPVEAVPDLRAAWLEAVAT
jgi:putative glutathione S-transferase